MKARTVPSALRMNSPDMRDLSPPRSHWDTRGRRVPDAFLIVVGGYGRNGPGPRVADTSDDGGQDLGQFWADEHDSLLVGLGGSDLQQWDDLAGGGQPVLDHRVMADLQHLLDAGAGVVEKLHRRPGPERAMLGLTEMAKSALLVPRASGRHVVGTKENRFADREGGTGRDGEQGLKVGRLLGVVIGRSPDERKRAGHTPSIQT